MNFQHETDIKTHIDKKYSKRNLSSYHLPLVDTFKKATREFVTDMLTPAEVDAVVLY